MPQTLLTPITPLGPYPGPVSAGQLAVAFQAADAVNGNSWNFGSRDLLIIFNSDTVAQTVTISSVADTFGRSQDITTYSLAAGTFAAFYITSSVGWKQSDNTVHLAASAATIKYGVFRC